MPCKCLQHCLGNLIKSYLRRLCPFFSTRAILEMSWRWLRENAADPKFGGFVWVSWWSIWVVSPPDIARSACSRSLECSKSPLRQSYRVEANPVFPIIFVKYWCAITALHSALASHFQNSSSNPLVIPNGYCQYFRRAIHSKSFQDNLRQIPSTLIFGSAVLLWIYQWHLGRCSQTL